MFANKVVLITGGSSGIGATTAELFAKEGAAVAFNGRNETKLKEVAQRCEKLGANTLGIKADLSNDQEAKSIIEKTIDKFGKLDVLVNNAGMVRFTSLLQPDLLGTYDEIMNTNLRAVILITGLAIPHLIKTKGNIVNVSSIASTSTKIPGLIPYCISKAGMDCFTRGAALELASSGVRVNSVNPGPVVTEILSSVDIPEALNAESMTALGKYSDANEISDMIMYLASDKARSITGSIYVIDNGTLLK